MFQSSGTAGWLFLSEPEEGWVFGQGKPVTTHPARETPQAGCVGLAFLTCRVGASMGH